MTNNSIDLAVEMGEHPRRNTSYATVHVAGCGDLVDPEGIGSASSLAEIDNLVVEATGWEPAEGLYERIAPCVKKHLR